MSTAIQTTKNNPQQILKAELEKYKGAMTEVLPKHITVERLVKVVLSATARNPKLLQCSVSSICRATMQAAELGLEIGGLLGHVYLVPYKGEAQAIVGYQGLLVLARNSGEVESIAAHVIYKDDTAHIDVANAIVKHEMNLQGDRSDASIIAAYCMVHLKGGGRHLEVMTKGDVDKIRKRSKSGGDGPWVTDYSEMARKTVTRRACKWIPRSAEKAEKLERALELDIEAEHVDVAEIKTSLKDRVKAAAAGSVAHEVVLDNGEVVEIERDPLTNEIIPEYAGREPGDD